MFLKYIYPAVLWAGFIIVSSGLPGNYIPGFVDFWDWLGWDKIFHLFVFAVLTFLVMRAFYMQYSFPWLRSNYIVTSLGFGIVFGFLMEVLQRFIFVGRSGNVYDLLADAVGCLLGWLIFYLALKKDVIRIKK